MDKSQDVSALFAGFDLAALLRRWDMSKLFITAAIALVTYLIIKAIYNIYFHPLRRFPGPFWHKISLIPQFLVRVQGLDPYFHLKQHEEYGDVVRVGPDALSFAHPDAWRDIYARAYDSGARRGIQRHTRMYTPWRQEKSVFNASGATHARQRKILAPAFSERACREYEPVLMKYVGQLVARLGEGGVQNMADMYQSATMDIMSEIAGREPTRFLESRTVHGGWSLEVEQKLYHLMMSLRTFPWWATWVFVRFVVLPIYSIAVEDQKFDAGLVKTRWAVKSSGTPHNTTPDRLEMWKYAQKDDTGSVAMPDEEMLENVKLLMFAGSETTANLLTGTTYFLLRNTEKLEALRSSLRSTFSSAEEMTMASLVKVDYLNACLKECLRLHPPVPSNMLRKIPADGASILGYSIPGDTEVSASPFAMNHLHKYYSDPWDYIPERWLGDDKYEDDSRDTFQPFSTGPQNCVGMVLAWHEARLMLANVVYNFDLRLNAPQRDWTKARGLVVWEKTPLLVQVSTR